MTTLIGPPAARPFTVIACGTNERITTELPRRERIS
jgi:hypothetical protein